MAPYAEIALVARCASASVYLRRSSVAELFPCLSMILRLLDAVAGGTDTSFVTSETPFSAHRVKSAFPMESVPSLNMVGRGGFRIYCFVANRAFRRAGSLPMAFEACGLGGHICEGDLFAVGYFIVAIFAFYSGILVGFMGEVSVRRQSFNTRPLLGEFLGDALVFFSVLMASRTCIRTGNTGLDAVFGAGMAIAAFEFLFLYMVLMAECRIFIPTGRPHQHEGEKYHARQQH